MKDFMKYIIILLVSMFLVACSDKNGPSVVEKATADIEGTYVAADKTSYTFKDGAVTSDAHGNHEAHTYTYKVDNDRIEFTASVPAYFVIKDNKRLALMGAVEYVKK